MSSMKSVEPILGARQTKIHYAWFAAIYFVLGLINAWEILLPVYLNEERGAAISSVSLALSLANLPAVFRVPFGLFTDKFQFFGRGYRKPYIMIGVVLSGVMWLSFAPLELNYESYTPDGFLLAHVSIFFAVQLLYALYDVTTDGFVAETVPNEQAGTVQGWIGASRGVGLVLGFLGFGFMGESLGWESIFWTLGALLLATTAGIPFLKEVPESERDLFNWDAFKVFKERKIQATCVFEFFVTMPANQLLFLLPVFLSDELGVSSGEIGVALGVAAICTALSAPIVGWLIDKYRHRFYMIWMGMFALGILTMLGLLLSAVSTGTLLIYPLAFIGGIYMGMLLSANLSLVMTLTDPAIASSFFAIMVTVYTAGQIVALAFIGPILENLGYEAAFILMIVLILLEVPLLPFVFPNSERRKPIADSSTDGSSENGVHVSEIELDSVDRDDFESSDSEALEISEKRVSDTGSDDDDQESGEGEKRQDIAGIHSSLPATREPSKAESTTLSAYSDTGESSDDGDDEGDPNTVAVSRPETNEPALSDATGCANV